jgi:phage FluMu gp28-like protein
MKIKILNTNRYYDEYYNTVLMEVRRGRKKYRVCDGLGIFGETQIQLGLEPRYYLVDRRGWRSSPPESDEQEVIEFATAYFRLVA